MPEPSWVDTHGHLFLLDEPADTVLGRAKDAGVDWLVCPGIDVDTSEASRELALLHPSRILWSAGLHPHVAGSWPEAEKRISELAAEALEKINEAWKEASEEMYKASQDGQEAPTEEPAGDADASQNGEESSDVEDVDFEEVK